MALHPQHVISLCTGGAGLDLAFELAVPAARTVCMVEREAFAVAHLVEKMGQGFLDECPVWSDVTTFRGRSWRGAVDWVIGGIPCQPHSQAGKRLGREDERDLWSHARRIFVQSGARGIVIENVEGMLSTGGAERVVRDLERLGCIVEGGLFSASEVGFPHRRNRVCIVGWRAGVGQADTSSTGSQGIWDGDHAGGRETAQRHAGLGGGAVLAHADRRQPARRPGGPGEPEAAGPHCQPAGSGDVLEDAECAERWPGDGPANEFDRSASGRPQTAGRPRGAGETLEHTARGRGRIHAGSRCKGFGAPDAGGRGGLPLSPPGPGDADGWRTVLEGWPTLEPARAVFETVSEPAVRRVADGMANRVDRLRMCGNGVHPLALANGIRTCLHRLVARGAAPNEFVLMEKGR